MCVPIGTFEGPGPRNVLQSNGCQSFGRHAELRAAAPTRTRHPAKSNDVDVRMTQGPPGTRADPAHGWRPGGEQLTAVGF